MSAFPSISRLLTSLTMTLAFAAPLAVAQHATAQNAKAPAASQTAVSVPSPSQTFPLHSVLLRGSGAYSEADALAATGLKLGQRVTQEELQQASNRLGGSGAFVTVSYQFMSLPSGGVDVTFDARDNPQVVPVIFQNLVWIPREQLLAALHERVPLFREKVPLAGDMSEQLRAALEPILAAKGVTARVATMTQGDLGKAPTAMEYSVENINVRVAAIDFTGLQAMDKILLDAAVEPQMKDSYLHTATSTAASNAIADVYLARGYLTIKVGEPQVTLADASPTAPAVKLTFPLAEGRQYNYAGVDWQGNTSFTAAELGAKIAARRVRKRQERHRPALLHRQQRSPRSSHR